MPLFLMRPIVRVYEATGAINARKLATLLGVSQADLAKAIGSDRTAIARETSFDTVQRRLSDVLALFLRVFRLTRGNEKLARIWLHAPNPALGYEAPAIHLSDHRIRLLDSIVSAIEEGTPD